MPEITLTEEFSAHDGRLTHYDTYLDNDGFQLAKQAHVDIRMMASAWSGATVGPDPTRGNFRIQSLALVSGANSMQVVDVNTPVDLENGFDDNDFISLALPSFPLPQVTLASSFVDLTSDPGGTFSAQTASVAFSASTRALINGNSEFRVPRSVFRQNGIDLSRVIGIRIRVQTTGAATFRLMAVRLLSKDWVFPSMDTSTRSALTGFRRSAPLNGDVTTPIAFNVPTLWRAAIPSGEGDPRPVDGEFAVIFNTGSSSQSNQFTLFFREVTEDFMTMLDLDGLTMGDLDGKPQPDVGQAMYGPRTQQDLSAYTQAELQGQSQYDLSRTPDYLSASWLQMVLQWSVGGTGSVSILDTNGNGYNLALPTSLSANTRYVFYARLEENTAQVTIYALDVVGNVAATPIFDSGVINDDITFPRRKGRFGWFAKFLDGDAYIESISSRKMNYAEYRSQPFTSNTPVVGAELFASTSPHTEFYQTLVPGPHNGVSTVITQDNGRSTTGDSWRVVTTGALTRQGIQTNIFDLSNFEDTNIHFDLYGTTVAGPLQAVLYSPDGREIPLLLPRLTPDQWQSIKIDLPFGQGVLGGRYSFALWQQNAVAATWWVDNCGISERSVAWDGRAVVDDPWLANVANWTPFKDNTNRDNGGILFPQRGNQLQIRGRARRQSAHIDSIKFKPHYAELGRFSFDIRAASVPATPTFTSSVGGSRTVTFTSTATDSDGFIINNEWTFGDGSTGLGPSVVHQYSSAGIYTVTLTVTDNNGNRTTQVGSVSV